MARGGADEIVDILFQVRQDQRELKRLVGSFDDIRQSVSKVDAQLKETFSKNSGYFDDFKKRFKAGFDIGSGAFAAQKAIEGVMAALRGVKDFVNRGIEFDATVEQSQVAFETLLGNAEDAKDRIETLIEFSARTPFRLPGIIDANRQLQVMTDGVLAGADGLRIAGDAAAATGREFNQVAFWIGRVYAGLKSGTPVGEATLRLIEMGLISGKTSLELQRLATEGHNASESFEIIERTFAKTEGAMERQSRTLTGLRTTLSDTIDQLAGDLAEPIFDGLKVGITELLELLDVLPDHVDRAVKEIQDIGISTGSKIDSMLDEKIAEVELRAGIAELENRAQDLRRQIDEVGVQRITTPGSFSGSQFQSAQSFDSYRFSGDIRNVEDYEAALASLSETEPVLRSLYEQLTKFDGLDVAPWISEERTRNNLEQLDKFEALIVAKRARLEGVVTNAGGGIVGVGSSDFDSVGQAQAANKWIKDRRALIDRLRPELERELAIIENAARAPEIAEGNKVDLERQKRLDAAEAAASKLLKSETQINKKYEERVKLHELDTATLADQEKILENRLQELDTQLAAEKKTLSFHEDQEDSARAIGLAEKKSGEERLAIEQKLVKVRKQIADENRKDHRERFSAEVKNQEVVLDQIKHQKEMLKLGGLSFFEREQYNLVLDKERSAIREIIALRKVELVYLLSIGEASKAAAEELTIQNLEQRLERVGKTDDNRTPFEKIREEFGAATPNGRFEGNAQDNYQDMGQAAQAALMEYQLQAGTIADQLHESILGIQADLEGGFSNAIQGLIDGTMSLNDAWESIRATIGQSMVKAIGDMAAQWIVSRLSMFALKKTLDAKEEASEKGSIGITALKAGYKALAQLGPIYGPLAFAGGVLAIKEIAGFETGGFPEGKNAIIRVNENGQESVLNAGATAALGRNVIDGLNAGNIGPAELRSNTIGGPIDGVSGGGTRIGLIDDIGNLDDWLDSEAGERKLVVKMSELKERVARS